MSSKKLLYEGYCNRKPTVARESFGSANIYERHAKSILSKASGYIRAYDFTLNPYRGCQYGCSYCYAAAFSPNPSMRQDWGNWVISKDNAPELLAKELQRWDDRHPNRPPKIYMSSVTDPYQPFETQKRITRQLLEVMVAYQPTLTIQTRSPMVVRDIDILQQLKRLRINMSVPTGSERVRKDFEPRSPSIQARLLAIGKLKYSLPDGGDRQVRCSITMTPLLPTFPEEQDEFINKLEIADRVVIQAFHASGNRSLVATTRQEATDLKRKYAWWYDREEECYQAFKSKLSAVLSSTEIKEGAEGFTYE